MKRSRWFALIPVIAGISLLVLGYYCRSNQNIRDYMCSNCVDNPLLTNHIHLHIQNLDFEQSRASLMLQPAKSIANVSAAGLSIPSQGPQVLGSHVPHGPVTEADINAVFVSSHDIAYYLRPVAYVVHLLLGRYGCRHRMAVGRPSVVPPCVCNEWSFFDIPSIYGHPRLSEIRRISTTAWVEHITNPGILSEAADSPVGIRHLPCLRHIDLPGITRVPKIAFSLKTGRVAGRDFGGGRTRAHLIDVGIVRSQRLHVGGVDSATHEERKLGIVICCIQLIT